MEKTVIFATGNQGKMEEIKEILSDIDVTLMSLKEAGIMLDVEENGKTFAENAMLKAQAAFALHPAGVVMADDSGLVIDKLNGEPGIYSARYLGEDTSYRIKNANLIERLKGVEEKERTARFVCAIAAVLPDGRVYTAEGTIEGLIGHEEKGENGFGYDPIFYLPGYNCTAAELNASRKNEISHRGKALAGMKEMLLEAGVFRKR